MCNKKKVAIITIYNESNYGNRLQNYAVQKCLEKWGFDAETIVISKPTSFISNTKLIVKNLISALFVNYVKKKRPEVIKNRNFLKFTKKYISTRYIKSQTTTFSKDIGNQYDMFVVGSDQVWNPCFGDYESLYGNMFLRFAPKEKRRCFSPSFGVSNIPSEWEERFTKGLSEIPTICVREQSGVDIVRNLCGKEAIVTIDPTLMIDSTEWGTIAKTVKGLPDKFVLDYFLGETPQEDLSYKTSIDSGLGQKRICLLDRSDINIYVSGPAEFIYLISRADLVCTDSFHACVFSILFGKRFMVFKRKDGNNNMLSRIETLLSLFGIKLDDNLGKKIFIEKEHVDVVLAKKRKELEDYFFRIF